jgi:hypothetical protein
VTSPFNWKTGAPSVLANERGNMATSNGLSLSQRSSLAITRREKATGRNPGTIAGLSPAADRQLLTPADRNRRRRR